MISRVKFEGVMYDLVLKLTVYKGFSLEYYDCVQNKYLFDTWRNGNTIEEVNQKWAKLLEGKDVEIFYSK